MLYFRQSWGRPIHQALAVVRVLTRYKMDSNQPWLESAVKIEIDVAEELPVFWRTEKDEQALQGQWRTDLFFD